MAARHCSSRNAAACLGRMPQDAPTSGRKGRAPQRRSKVSQPRLYFFKLRIVMEDAQRRAVLCEHIGAWSAVPCVVSRYSVRAKHSQPLTALVIFHPADILIQHFVHYPVILPLILTRGGLTFQKEGVPCEAAFFPPAPHQKLAPRRAHHGKPQKCRKAKWKIRTTVPDVPYCFLCTCIFFNKFI